MPPAFEVVGGGVPTPEEVAAIAAALTALLDERPAPASPPTGRWRWSGRRWDMRDANDVLRAPLDWRRTAPAAHPSGA